MEILFIIIIFGDSCKIKLDTYGSPTPVIKQELHGGYGGMALQGLNHGLGSMSVDQHHMMGMYPGPAHPQPAHGLGHPHPGFKWMDRRPAPGPDTGRGRRAEPRIRRQLAHLLRGQPDVLLIAAPDEAFSAAAMALWVRAGR